jgi:hypothetical protein
MVWYGMACSVSLPRLQSHQDKDRDYDDLTRPEQLNVLADCCATAALDQLRAGGKPQRSTHFLRVGAIFVIATAGISPVVKYAHSETHYLSKSFETICNAATIGQTRPTIQSIGLLIIQPAQDSLTTPEHSQSATHRRPRKMMQRHVRSLPTLQRSRDCFPSVPLPVQSRVASSVPDPPQWTSPNDHNSSRHTLHHHQGYRELVSERRH